MKSQVTLAANVRKSTTLFAQALLAVGVKVKFVNRHVRFDMHTLTSHTTDAMRIKGNGRFDAHLLFDYEANRFDVEIRGPRGTQMKAIIASYNELVALFNVWNIASY